MFAKDLDRLVECHRVSRERIAAGRPVWDRTINIKPILYRDQGNETPEHAASVANEIGALIRTSVPAGWLDWDSDDCDETLLEIVEGMECLRPDSYANESDGYTPLEDLNNMLAGLYDWADDKRVWLGA